MDSALEEQSLTNQKNEKTYYHRPEIIENIQIACSHGDEQILALLKIQEEKDSNFLKNETLVYLIRNRYKNDSVLADQIYEILIKRIKQIVNKYKTFFSNEADKDDYIADILFHLAKEIKEKKEESVIYAEASFGQWVVRCGANFYRGYERIKEQDHQQDSLEKLKEDGNIYEPTGLTTAFLPADSQLIIKETVAKLSPHERELFHLHYILGMQVFSKDEKILTLSKHFGKTPRTINDRLRKIENEFASVGGKRI